LLHEERGQLARLTRAISEAGGNFVAFGTFSGENPSNRLVTFKVEGLDQDTLKAMVEPLVEKLVDIRFCCS
jgi:acetoin utilization protein AcuB